MTMRGSYLLSDVMALPLRRPHPVRPLVVLAVDNEETRAAYAYGLAATGFDVTTAAEATTRHPFVPGARPSIIVADVSDQQRGGWTPVQQFRRDPRTCDVPIVAVAAEVGATTRERARREGCAAVCLSTCPPDVLASGLRAVLERAS
jgi:CheY-like chemotaxis protein